MPAVYRKISVSLIIDHETFSANLKALDEEGYLRVLKSPEIDKTERKKQLMKYVKLNEIFLEMNTIAAPLFKGKTYPWEILPLIGDYILRIGPSLSLAEFDNAAEGVWVAKDAKINKSAYIAGPCIVDHNAEIRHCAFIRGNVIVGKNTVVGNSTELKNAVLFDKVQTPHYNYVGDSILGYGSHMGAGSIMSNVKSDKTRVKVKSEGEEIDTGLKKFGAIIGDFAEVGCGSVLNPGTIIGPHTNIYPLSSVRGVIKQESIYKNAGEIVLRR